MSNVSDDPTVIYKPYTELLKDNSALSSNNKDVSTGTKTVDNILKVFGTVLVGLDCKNKVTVAASVLWVFVIIIDFILLALLPDFINSVVTPVLPVIL